ncbi:type I glyceraldehyde-3-phosphate dehydrogenase [candidate division WWE3 bacterium]|jgi:glyceraldehyde 3-phosphate dehydrogenase|uniref:Glyceraldehyde-3-phosphate dehydrogenase n=1 Tax=candidate division WWE3 bacterium TaxID=2053526 RepID=A0A3A4ZJ84_UNCKA|nr:MAG: type I glyceraldehyde-3-phosphate dehydrogenase [candidate division WWE3 bacterium]
MTARIAINGFGRIGRASFKIAADRQDVEVVAINDLTNPRILAHLLKYDTAYGIFSKEVHLEEDGKVVKMEDTLHQSKDFFSQSAKETYLIVDNKKIKVLSEKDPALLPWKDMQVDVVLECTGRFTKDDAAAVHVQSGAKKVVVSAPTKGGTTQTFLMGVNDEQYLGQNVISNASCTTNCISPVVRVIHENFKILKSAMTTVHAVTAEQNVVDGPPPPLHPDMRRARAASFNMVPTTTGAAKATTSVIPELSGLFDGISIRVPIVTGSISDITMLVEKKTSAEEINEALSKASKDPKYKNVLSVTYDPLVSSDIVGTPYSAICDLSMTKVIDGDLVKVLAWYDNEWGYSNRLVEMAVLASA